MKSMRMVIAVGFLLLCGLSASGQPFVSEAVLTDVLGPRDTSIQAAAPAVAMAMDRHGVVIAGTMLNAGGAQAVYVARVDSGGRIVGPATEISPAGAANSVDAYWPSIAVSPGGTGFTLAWVERLRVPRPSSVSAVYSQLGADLKPSAPRVLTTMAAADVSVAAIVRSGRSTWISAGGTVWEIQTNGSPGRVLDAGAPVTGMVATADYPQVVTGQNIQTGWVCTGDPRCSLGGPFIGYCHEACRLYRYAYELRFVSLYTGSATKQFSFKSDSGPAIQSDGGDVLVAWLNGDSGAGGPVTVARLNARSFDFVSRDLESGWDIGTFGPNDKASRPDIAVDGERYVVVWSTRTSRGDRDIVGAFIDRENGITNFSIAATAADESDPSILKTSSGTFLVAYELNHGLSEGERRIATRFLRFDGRRRAVR